MQDDVVNGWLKFVTDANKDSGYAHSHQGGLDRSALEDRWRRECPGLEMPVVQWSNETGRYELIGISKSKK